MIYRTIQWSDIEPVWSQQLWPDRKSPIETHSAMMWPYAHTESEFSMGVFQYPVKFLGAYDGDRLVGVNSGHMCDPFHYRSRGLWVHPEHRGRGIAQTLFAMLENHAQIQGAVLMWSLPRLSAVRCYERYGFETVGAPLETETSEANIYARKFISAAHEASSAWCSHH